MADRDRECLMTEFGPLRRTIAEILHIRADDGGEPYDRGHDAPPLVADSAKKAKDAEGDLIAKITDSLSALERKIDAMEKREKVAAADAARRKAVRDALAQAEEDAENGRPLARLDPISRAEQLAREFSAPPRLN
ncbi:hypothetical protein [Rhodoblastus sp.]|jgi:hypothetical protein|uniref:hypothetical protein n=1 Tax=Rhodoblastus sp. TaxID=1962975 RepID=UPI0025D496F1|nr:hypothetical protein [Rhodoblastus sp.]